MDHSILFSNYERDALAAFNAASSDAEIEAARIEFLGKKNGRLRDLQNLLVSTSSEQRQAVGKLFNDIKERVRTAYESRKAALIKKPGVLANLIDLTFPGASHIVGKRHPLTQTIDEFKQILGRLGFDVVEGPEIEDEWHNFVALNIPADHPARNPVDNFYFRTLAVDQARLLRSQTSTVQIRIMENQTPPVRIVSVGRVYRPDMIDATHHLMFHQIEGLMIGENVTLSSLKTLMRIFAIAYLGDGTEIRFRPSFFPFTEPSVEFDAWRENAWLELGGAGMVDPNVLSSCGYNPDLVGGFAFGLGVARFCMMRHKVDDIRNFYDNQLAFLTQY